jgi:hypothetical protein
VACTPKEEWMSPLGCFEMMLSSWHEAIAAEAAMRSHVRCVRHTLAGCLLGASIAALSGCGHSQQTQTAATTTTQQQQQTSPAVTVGGCGAYCQQAGPPEGTRPATQPENPYERCLPEGEYGCKPCPPSECVTVLSTSATVTNGTFTVPIRCNLKVRCEGIFIVIDEHLAHIAASEFLVQPGQDVTIGVALTQHGNELVQSGTSFTGEAYVALKELGFIVGDEVNHRFELTS